MDSQPDHHRKIELQSPADLSYLISAVRAAAASHIDRAFPPVPSTSDHPSSTNITSASGQEDERRSQSASLVSDYIARTSRLAAPYLTVTGLPIDDPASCLSRASSSSTRERQQEPD